MPLRNQENDLLEEIYDLPEPRIWVGKVDNGCDYFRRIKLTWDEPLSYAHLHQIFGILGIRPHEYEHKYSAPHRVNEQVLTIRVPAPDRFWDEEVPEIKLEIPLFSGVATKAKMWTDELLQALLIDSRRRKLALLVD